QLERQSVREVITAWLDGKIDAAEASRALGKSLRQVYRLKARARSTGRVDFTHGNRGRVPINKIPQEVWDRVLSLVRSQYQGLSCYELQVRLADNHRILIGRESLRKRLRAAGIPTKRQSGGRPRP